jgi:hypothetical protein
MQKQIQILARALDPQTLRFASGCVLVVLALSLGAPARANPAKAAADREFAAAVEQFKEGRKAHAFGMFIALANRGDVDAARIALFMHTYGPLLYGAHWDAGDEDREYWSTLVRNSSTAGRPQPAFTPLAVVPKGRLKQVRAPARVTASISSGE